ncbi:MAG: helix-turn-helix domain-containing protein [Armatimonadetes bacterium]|nr:helix-turn-helix domain-containing protein [Armatimonadota bacterium]
MSESKQGARVVDDLLAGLQEGLAWARGETDLRVSRLDLPAPPPAYTPEQIRAIRGRSGLSQGQFSLYLSISAKTLQSWEQGLRRPSPMSSRFLQVIDQAPDVLLRLPTRPAR